MTSTSASAGRSAIAIGRIAAIAAPLLFIAALLAFGGLREGYAQWRHPVAWLGAAGTPRALAFNLAGFVLPGLLAAVAAWRLRDALPAASPLLARVGGWLVLISAGAFALQGLLPIDARDLDSPASHAHALMWTLWWVAFVPGVLLQAVLGSIGRRQAWIAACAGLLVATLAASPWPLLPAALSQRLAFLAWFAWIAVATRQSQRPALPGRPLRVD